MSRLVLNEGAAPSTPASGKGALYLDSTGRLKLFGDDGTVNELAERYRDNAVRNSGMWFAQRQTPGSATTYSSTNGRAIGIDGFGVTNENASVTVRRVDARSAPESGLQSGYWGEYLKITAAGKIHVSQVIEGVLEDEEQMDAALRKFGYVSGQAFQCHTKEEQIKLERTALNVGTNILPLFGPDRAFFYAAAFGAGMSEQLDRKICPAASKQATEMIAKLKILSER